MVHQCLPIFVYGTLQRGEQRERLWPCIPRLVQGASTPGDLYDLGPYPAMIAGKHIVCGELWHLAAHELELTLDTLDRIEGYGVGDSDLYVRRIVQCETREGEVHAAYAYFFADPGQLVGVPMIGPDKRGVCRWRRASG